MGFHRGWWDADGARRHGGAGKALRPALVLLSAAASGSDPDSALNAALCVELVHDWSLIHDDVMDEDAERRHRPTLWAEFGTAHAVLAGDLILTLGLQMAAGLGSSGLQIITDTLEELCLGQWTDLDSTGNEVVTVQEALATAAGKTGALLSAACQLGARVDGTTHKEQVHHYAKFGRELGIAFQAADDLLGIWGDPDRTGKPVAADIAARKRTLPVCAALSSGHSSADELTAILKSPQALTSKEIAHAASLIELTGGREWTEALVNDRTMLALTDLAAAKPVEPAGETFDPCQSPDCTHAVTTE